MDLYGKTFLVKVAHIFIVYHPLKERKSVSVTKHKIWAIEICPKMSLSTPDFTFWAISQDRDAPGQIYLTTSDHHGGRNLGQQEKIFALGTSYSRISPLWSYLCLIYFKITWPLAILLKHMYKKFEINQTKIKGGCQSGRKVITHNSKSDLPFVREY